MQARDSEHLQYERITTSSLLANLAVPAHSKAIVIAETAVSDERRAEISQWLVTSGCLYMMIWGTECRAWQDAVNLANLQSWDFGSIPDDCLVITTSHPDETLTDVFWFSKHTAMHPCASLEKVVLIHITKEGVAEEYQGEHQGQPQGQDQLITSYERS
jgi:hypothetical protein